MRANSLTKVVVTSNGTITLYYIDHQPVTLTYGEVSMQPLKRIPLFNVLKSNSKWKPVIEDYLSTFLGWRVTFMSQGDIDEKNEEFLWRRYLGLGKTTEVTSGIRTRRP